MLILQLLALSYLIFIVITAVMIRAATKNVDQRKVFFIVAIVTPFITAWAFMTQPFRAKKIGYNEDLAGMDDVIELERIKIFGGSVVKPSLSERWHSGYKLSLARAAARAARTSEKIKLQLHVNY